MNPAELSILSDFLFGANNPSILSLEELEAKFPPRKEQVITRFAPSPTGFLHIGGVYASLFSERFAHHNDGVFYLRVEDTDQKREVEGAVKLITDGLEYFGIQIDEGPIGPNGEDVGAYGPYTQSKRETLYKSFAKMMIEKGFAYPCFLAENEIEEIRAIQAACGDTVGIYGHYSRWRGATLEEVTKELAEGKSWVLRFKAPYNPSARIKLIDEIRGEIEMQDNFLDIVLLKTNGLPTYHFAHVADDYLMRTTHIVRGDEWLPSYPLHAQLFKTLELPLPKYIHLATIAKIENGNKRKLSKRKDPEASVEFFFEAGYPKEAVLDYLLNIMDSKYEAWRIAHMDSSFKEYPIEIKSLGASWSLFDIEKLNSISNAYLTHISTQELFERGYNWAKKYDQNLARLIDENKDLALKALNIERHSEKDPRRFTTFADLKTQLSFFFDETYEELYVNKEAFPENIDTDTLKALVSDYIKSYNPNLDKDAWFADLKELGARHNFARDNAEYKAGGKIGKVGDIAMVLRILLCGARQTPDLHAILQVLPEQTRLKRLGWIL